MLAAAIPLLRWTTDGEMRALAGGVVVLGMAAWLKMDGFYWDSSS